MSEIKIRTELLTSSEENLKSLSTNMAAYSERLDSVGASLPFSFSEKEKIIRVIKEAATSIQNQSVMVSSMSSALFQIATLYEKTENNIIGNCKGQNGEAIRQSYGDTDQTTTTFDDDPHNGGYGGDQGDMAHNLSGFQFLWWRLFEDEELFDFFRRYPQYSSYSQKEIAALMEQMNEEGCGYIAMVNAIFVQYEGREEEFEKIFGFPMYDKNGEANYNRLFIDIYANTDDQFYLDGTRGEVALLNDICNSMTEEEFIAKFGCPPTDENGYFTKEAKEAVLEAYSGQDVVTFEVSGTTTYSLENRMEHYMQEKGISYSMTDTSNLTVDNVNALIDNGSNVTIGISEFNLYDESGKAVREDVGGHWMTITGVTDDGRYIVSSWGERYYLDPTELKDPEFSILNFE